MLDEETFEALWTDTQEFVARIMEELEAAVENFVEFAARAADVLKAAAPELPKLSDGRIHPIRQFSSGAAEAAQMKHCNTPY